MFDGCLGNACSALQYHSIYNSFVCMIIGGGSGVVSGPPAATESTNNNNEVQEVHRDDISKQQQQRHKTISKVSQQMRNSKTVVQKKLVRVWKQRTLQGKSPPENDVVIQKNNDTPMHNNSIKTGMSC